MHADTGVIEAGYAGGPSKVAAPVVSPDPHDSVGRKRRPKKVVRQQEQSFKSLPDEAAAAVSASQDTAATVKATAAIDEATAAAELANPGQQGLPRKPWPHNDQKGGMLHRLLMHLRHEVVCLTVYRPVKEVTDKSALLDSSLQATHDCYWR